MFRPAQPIRIVTRKELGDRALGPTEPATARLPLQLHSLPPRDRQQPAHPLDHHRPRLVDRRRDQRDPAPALLRQPEDPLRSCPGLAEAAPGHHQPYAPALAVRRQLPVRRPGLERGVKRQQLLRPALGQPGAELGRLHQRQQLDLPASDAGPHFLHCICRGGGPA